MDAGAAIDWCRLRPGAAEEFPFGPQVRVFKVGGKLFALFPVDDARVNLKCDPRFAERLRTEHRGVAPAYHMNKRHWNSVRLDGSVPGDLVEELLGHSYTLVVDSLPRGTREALRSEEEGG
jgi:predicted DNA-binding protein (MmcQ/YjbR family)